MKFTALICSCIASVAFAQNLGAVTGATGGNATTPAVSTPSVGGVTGGSGAATGGSNSTGDSSLDFGSGSNMTTNGTMSDSKNSTKSSNSTKDSDDNKSAGSIGSKCTAENSTSCDTGLTCVIDSKGKDPEMGRCSLKSSDAAQSAIVSASLSAVSMIIMAVM
ncbi:hypothetical protein MP228_009272 [Amoeboaphelidium protococcarum]|nr:hypothetical protein MP228_009272 [Amoeboaphelidium protococcarum]